ncbi:CcdB family protein, partial [Algiphilus sp. W345]
FDDYSRRVVVPLVLGSQVEAIGRSALNPVFTVDGLSVVLHSLEIVSVSRDRLGPVAGSLAAEGDRIIGALED